MKVVANFLRFDETVKIKAFLKFNLHPVSIDFFFSVPYMLPECLLKLPMATRKGVGEGGQVSTAEATMFRHSIRDKNTVVLLSLLFFQ